MPLYVAEGKSITTRRGVVGCDDDRPEILMKDLHGVEGDAASMERARDAAKRLLAKGYLVEADKSPWHAAEAVRAGQIAELEGKADAQRAKTRARRQEVQSGAVVEPTAPAPPVPAPPVPVDPLAAASEAAGKEKSGGRRKGGAKRGG